MWCDNDYEIWISNFNWKRSEKNVYLCLIPHFWTTSDSTYFWILLYQLMWEKTDFNTNTELPQIQMNVCQIHRDIWKASYINQEILNTVEPVEIKKCHNDDHRRYAHHERNAPHRNYQTSWHCKEMSLISLKHLAPYLTCHWPHLQYCVFQQYVWRLLA